jgi:hypothetical protein
MSEPSVVLAIAAAAIGALFYFIHRHLDTTAVDGLTLGVGVGATGQRSIHTVRRSGRWNETEAAR